jgi:hypothetical protein
MARNETEISESLMVISFLKKKRYEERVQKTEHEGAHDGKRRRDDGW